MWKILLASDGSEGAIHAARFAAAMAWDQDARIRILTVTDPHADRAAGEDVASAHRRWLDEAGSRTRAAFEDSRAQVEAAGRSGHPAQEIVVEARELDADLVVLGTRGLTGLRRLFLGSVARNVASHADCPVLLTRGTSEEPRTVLVCTDGSEGALQAIDFASRLPWPLGTNFRVLSVAIPFTPVPDQFGMDVGHFGTAILEVREDRRKSAERLAEEGVEELRAAGLGATSLVREGDAAHEILDEAEQTGCDLIVAGARGVTLLERIVIGSVADRLVSHAHCSLLIVR